MKISYNWLKNLLDFNLDIESTSELLTDIGLEVEKIHNYSSVSTDLSQLIVGEVKDCSEHPNADRLKVTKVDVGSNDFLTIICGAPNVELGQRVVVAPVGSKLITNSNETFKIKKSKIRGIYSEGMLCAEDEIGIGENHDGIILLNNKFKIGDKVSKIFNSYDDFIFEIGLTPNRCDAISHYGVARDLRAALSYRNEANHELILPSILSFTNLRLAPSVSVEIKNSDLCSRFCGIIIKDIKIRPSSKKIQNKLNSIGLKPINNVVDITNYVMHEIGQPLHAYDLDKIKSGKIEIKTLINEKSFITLDGVEIKVGKDDLMVCDGDVPMCIAGVYGGQDHSVNNETKTIFLESAFFNPVSVRKTSKKHNINTDSSYRFERGVDIEMVQYALKRAATLIVEDSDSEIICDLIDEYPSKTEEKDVVLNFEKVNNLIGCNIDKLKVKSILNLLDFKINNVTDVSAGITIPSYRHDVNRECDVVEEILRIHGYNNIPEDENIKFSISSKTNLKYNYENIISNYLSSIGFNEIMNNSLVDNYSKNSDFEAISLINSISNDISIMRADLLTGILNTISYNINRKNTSNSLYEFGSIYTKKGNSYQEKKVLGISLNGDLIKKSWLNKALPNNFFYLKNIILNIIKRFNIDFSEKIIDPDTLIIEADKKGLCKIITIPNDKLIKHGIKSPVFYATFDIDLFYSLISNDFFNIKTISKFPGVSRDFSFILDDEILNSDIKQTIYSVDPVLIKIVKLNDSYKSEKTDNKKSYSFSVYMESNLKTLAEKEIKNISNKIINKVIKKHRAVLRDQ